jgi:hypothetical protein
MKAARTALMVVVAVGLAASTPLRAHEMTVKGTVAAIEKVRIQVKTGLEKTGEPPAWYPIDDKTKIKRGKDTVKLADAKITVDERVVLIVDHPSRGPMKTKEIRLAPQ